MATRVLFVASEVFPLVKTGGLGDVIGALPGALRRCGADLRILLPGFPEILGGIDAPRRLLTFGPVFGASVVTLVSGRLPKSDVGVYVIDAPFLYARPGNPYVGPDGHPWPDNHLRFALLGWVAAHLAGGELDRWRPQIVHGHDWHAGLAPVFLSAQPLSPVRTVFTVHNLAFQGLFSLESCAPLGLPPESLTPSGLEFHGQVSFMKGGLHYADALTTVSPSYAREILTPRFGFGLDGVMAQRADTLSGILNGVDYEVWSPDADPLIAQRYEAEHLSGKDACKTALQRELGLAEAPGRPLLAVVSRLTEQKGLDLLLQCLPKMVHAGAQLAVLGSGDKVLEDGFRHVEAAHPGSVAVRTGFDEALSHRIFAGADMILVPSRFEPCGLTQMYGLRYGAVPIVHRVGGLADTVVDATAENLAAQRATGFVFAQPQAASLAAAIDRALELYRQPAAWKRLAARGMAQDFSWDRSAELYMGLYRRLLEGPEPGRAARNSSPVGA